MATSDTSAPRPTTKLSAFQRDALFALAKIGPSKGLEIKRELQTEYDTEINHGRLYPNLDTLADRGLIEKRPGEDSRSNQYELSERGRQALETHREWEQECLEEGA